MLNSEVEEAIRLIQAAKVGAEPSPELAALAKENPAAYTAAIRKANSLMNFDFGDVLDLGNAENQRKFLTNDPPPPFDKTAKEEQKLWRNYMLDYSTKVERWERPNTLDRLVNAVRDAGAAKKPIRAVGAGHSSADVARPPPSGLVELDKLERITLPPFLKQGVDASRLRRMEAGISIRHVNDLLRRETQDYPHGLALENMGSYDEQSIIGAACTGTHGSGIGLPALNGSLASVVLVTLREQGGKMVPRILQIEPSNGVTDPTTFDRRTGGLDADLYTPSADLSWELIQDDRYFNAISVSLGCFGVVYAVTLRLRPSFWLEESRVVMPWRKVKQSFLDDMKKVRCYELLISPYPTFQEDGSLDYTTLVTRRKEIPWQDEVPKTRKMGLASFADRLIADLNISDMATELISDVLMNDPKVETHLPYQIDRVIRMLQVKDYRSWAPKVLLLNAGNSMMAWSCEVAIPLSQATKAVDAIVGLARVKMGKEDGGRHTSPIGIRFVAPSSALISPQRYPEGTCMIEIPILRSSKPQQLQILKDIQNTLVPPYRTHWGQLHWLDERDGKQSPGIALDRIRTMYGDEFDQWMEVYQELNPRGMFSNDFTRRHGMDSLSGATS